MEKRIDAADGTVDKEKSNRLSYWTLILLSITTREDDVVLIYSLYKNYDQLGFDALKSSHLLDPFFDFDFYRSPVCFQAG